MHAICIRRDQPIKKMGRRVLPGPLSNNTHLYIYICKHSGTSRMARTIAMMIDDGEALSSMSRHVIHRERKCLSYSAQREFVKRELVDDPKPIDCGMYLFGDGTGQEREKGKPCSDPILGECPRRRGNVSSSDGLFLINVC